ncbi:ABC transporter substrate-binding protein [Paralimibaculum aggregatum]|uniref:ABC transporter substrate-binding protein n=1 Tax=Paralimibaculum aggregatum TaxID=3036245 RepID=A0ABQ6LS61_9RHOB|nr:extracellular solute-binding protein [Limibaculum sp. NKW23]GMG84621.1 ABC transporter substrate-binding protein [Limibaculum sp. NKW23]
MISRRSLLKGSVALGGAAVTLDLAGWAKAWAADDMMYAPEEGASLQLLRWKRFVQSEEDSFLALVAAFTAATGVAVEVLSESMDDVQPKASVAANVGTGPDMFWGLYSLPHLFSEKCIDVTDLCTHLGEKYGGWAPSAEVYGTSGDKWIAVPVAYNANLINFRISAMNEAGFSEMPGDLEGFLELNKALKGIGKPGGMALGHASGDGNAWVHWVLWAHGGYLVDANDEVIINSPETEAALEYARQLYEAWIPGTASWNDAFNNKAFLAEEVWLTNNGVSIYAAAKRQAAEDPKMAMIAEDMDHAFWPIGPAGKPTEFHICYPLLGMQYTRYPNAVKAFMQFLMEAEHYEPWLEGAVAYLSHSYKAGDDFAFWSADPKLVAAKPAAWRTSTAGHLGSVGEKAAAALADFIVLDMVANACSGRESVSGAIKIAERQAKRLYR